MSTVFLIQAKHADKKLINAPTQSPYLETWGH